MTSSSTLRPGRHFLLAFILILAIIAADQYSKWFVMETLLRTQENPPLFKDWFLTLKKVEMFETERETFKTVSYGSFLNIVMVWNQGISFGLFQSASRLMSMVFIGISLMLSMGMLIWLALSRSFLTSFALALVVGGAIGNVIDRIRFGAVVDFIDVYFGTWHWPAFNVADSGIVLGAFLLILNLAFDKKQ